jgi:hypothetical protein
MQRFRKLAAFFRMKKNIRICTWMSWPAQQKNLTWKKRAVLLHRFLKNLIND